MSAERPQTSKPRGICKYYQTDRGCYNGDNCRFLHGEHEQLTPFDKSKTCKFFAAGYCRRGSQCWFRHVEPGSSQTAVQPSPSVETVDEDTELCSICYEKPVTYGLLGGCSHLFCLRCIREWRDPSGKPSDMVSSGSTKKCPMCRAHSRFITPSSIFYTQGDPRKIEAIEKYKASMARVPCKHFQQSPPERRYCPFGQDCFYQHLNADGTPFIFKHGFDRRHRQRSSQQDIFTYLLDPLDDISMTINAMRARLPTLFERVNLDSEDESEDDDQEDVGEPAHDTDDLSAETIQRLTDILQAEIEHEGWGHVTGDWNFGNADDLDQSNTVEVASVVANNVDLPSSPRPRGISRDDVALTPGPVAAGSAVTTDHGSQASAAGPSLSTTSDPTRSATSRFSTVVLDRGRFVADYVPGTDVGELRNLPPAVAGPSTMGRPDPPYTAVPSLAARQESDAQEAVIRTSSATVGPAETSLTGYGDTPSEVNLHDMDPPFMTDGRGRVVWSSTTSSHQRDGRRTRSGPASAFAQPKVGRPSYHTHTDNHVSEAAAEARPHQSPATDDGFVTDGRGRVVFASGARSSGASGSTATSAEDTATDAVGAPENPSPAPVPRSFLGAIFDAAFSFLEA